MTVISAFILLYLRCNDAQESADAVFQCNSGSLMPERAVKIHP